MSKEPDRSLMVSSINPRLWKVGIQIKPIQLARPKTEDWGPTDFPSYSMDY